MGSPALNCQKRTNYLACQRPPCPSLRRTQNASAGLRIFVRLPKRLLQHYPPEAAGRTFITAQKWLLVIDEPLTTTRWAGWRRILPCLYASAQVVNLGTKDCSSARRSLSNRSMYGRFELG